jgi:hypothetical protein
MFFSVLVSPPPLAWLKYDETMMFQDDAPAGLWCTLYVPLVI